MTTQRTTKLGEREITRLGLGTNRLTDTADNRQLIRAAVDAGIGLIDTAHTYTGGSSEATIGAALEGLAHDVVVATKGGYAPGHGRPEILRGQIEESLRRLRTDRIGLYYLHRVDPQTPLEVSLRVIADFVERGQIEHVGLSQVDAEQIERARSVVPISAVQNHFNLSERGWDAVVDYCAANGILFVPYFPLRGDGGAEARRIAERHAATPPQIALAWLLKRSVAMLPIPGTLSPAHVRDNLAALDIELSDDEFEALA